MAWTIAVALMVLWALGVQNAYTLDGFIHVLVIAALAMVVVHVFTSRRTAA